MIFNDHQQSCGFKALHSCAVAMVAQACCCPIAAHTPAVTSGSLKILVDRVSTRVRKGCRNLPAKEDFERLPAQQTHDPHSRCAEIELENYFCC